MMNTISPKKSIYITKHPRINQFLKPCEVREADHLISSNELVQDQEAPRAASPPPPRLPRETQEVGLLPTPNEAIFVFLAGSQILGDRNKLPATKQGSKTCTQTYTHKTSARG